MPPGSEGAKLEDEIRARLYGPDGELKYDSAKPKKESLLLNLIKRVYPLPFSILRFLGERNEK